MSGHLERIRYAELESLRGRFVKGMRVLELGGGSGYQASLLHSWGCDVTSLDLKDRHIEPARYYPVQSYDGRHIPYPASSFDIVFSSNVLEHVEGLQQLCGETRRVVKDDGLAIHIVPTATWRLWTSLGYYLYLVKRMFGRADIACAVSVPSAADLLRARGLTYLLRRLLIAGPHGAYPTALSELYYYREKRWIQVFQKAGFEVVAGVSTGVFHTGYALLPSLSIATRGRLARVLGSACHAFIMRPARLASD